MVPDCADFGAEGRDVRWVREEVVQDVCDGHGVEVDCGEEQFELEPGLVVYGRRGTLFRALEHVPCYEVAGRDVFEVFCRLALAIFDDGDDSTAGKVLPVVDFAALRYGFGVVGPDLLREGAPAHFPAAFGQVEGEGHSAFEPFWVAGEVLADEDAARGEGDDA